MNNFVAIEVDYIRPNRTVETIFVTKREDPKLQKVFYIYSYEGVHYRLFEKILDLSQFLNGKEDKIVAEYLTEKELDDFLAKIDIGLYN